MASMYNKGPGTQATLTFLVILSLVGGCSVQGLYQGLQQTQVFGAVWPWAGGLTSLCLFPHGSSGGMLEASLLQGVVRARWDEVCKEQGRDGCMWVSLPEG